MIFTQFWTAFCSFYSFNTQKSLAILLKRTIIKGVRLKSGKQYSMFKVTDAIQYAATYAIQYYTTSLLPINGHSRLATKINKIWLKACRVSWDFTRRRLGFNSTIEGSLVVKIHYCKYKIACSSLPARELLSENLRTRESR